MSTTSPRRTTSAGPASRQLVRGIRQCLFGDQRFRSKTLSHDRLEVRSVVIADHTETAHRISRSAKAWRGASIAAREDVSGPSITKASRWVDVLYVNCLASGRSRRRTTMPASHG